MEHRSTCNLLTYAGPRFNELKANVSTIVYKTLKILKKHKLLKPKIITKVEKLIKVPPGSLLMFFNCNKAINKLVTSAFWNTVSAYKSSTVNKKIYKLLNESLNESNNFNLETYGFDKATILNNSKKALKLYNSLTK